MSETTLIIDLRQVLSKAITVKAVEADMAKTLHKLQAAGADKWRRLADSSLSSSASDYKAAIRTGATEGGRVVFIELAGSKIASMIENGFEGGDMRTWMLKSPKAKTSKDGTKWLVVPFRHGTPGANGSSSAAGSGTLHVGSRMPPAIHRAAAKLAGTVSRLDAAGKMKTQWGAKLHEGSKGVNETAHKLLTTKQQPWHALSVYQGMVRKAQPDHSKKGSQTSGYTTFRVISSRVKRGPKHWHHPGIKAKHLARQVADYIDKIAGPTFVGVLKERGA